MTEAAMNTQEFLTFQKFKDPDIANDIAEKLKGAGVIYKMENDDKFFDPTFSSDPLQRETRIKLKPGDFSKANKILGDYYQSLLSDIDKDYYLFDFSDKELYEILAKPDEWGPLDYQLAQQILKDRGLGFKPEELESLNKKRIHELSRPEKSNHWMILAGYVCSFSLAFVGVGIGLALINSKKTLPDGRVVYTYTEADRNNGYLITSIGIGMIILAFIFRFELQRYML